MVTVRPISGSTATELVSFKCSKGLRAPWTGIAEEIIQELLPDAITSGDVEALGLYLTTPDRPDQLAGVAAYRMEGGSPPICNGIVLAVRLGHWGRGYGRLLKEAEIQAAKAAGAAVVVSRVHWDNTPMLKIIEALGGSAERVPGDYDEARCWVPIVR